MQLAFGNNACLRNTLTINNLTRQSLQVLSMSSFELENYIGEQFMENPVIEIGSGEAGSEADNELLQKLNWLEQAGFNSRSSRYDEIDYSEEGKSYEMEEDDETLYRHLHSQLILLPLSHREFCLCNYIIQLLDDNGYLDISFDEIRRLTGIDQDFIGKCLRIVQTLEPIGIGARNLTECLELQLKGKNVTEQYIYEIVERFFDKVSQNKLGYIAKQLKLPIDKITKAMDIIKTLSPYPGRAFGGKQEVAYIKPDIFVLNFEDKLEVVINEMAYPSIKISSYYKNVFSHGNDEDSKKYISKKIGQAEWLVKCISSRNNTLYRVVNEIVRVQEDFFRKGVKNLKTLRLQDIAQELGIHESTVSRAINNKYLQCVWGVFKLKYFFTSSGTDYSANCKDNPHNIKEIILAMIGDEDKRNPLSDQGICDRLSKMGFSTARRTVSKYREELDILPSAQRKIF